MLKSEHRIMTASLLDQATTPLGLHHCLFRSAWGMKFRDDGTVEGIAVTLETGLGFKLIYVKWRNDLSCQDGIQHSAQHHFKEERSMPVTRMGHCGLSSISVERIWRLQWAVKEVLPRKRRTTGEMRTSSPLSKGLLPKGRE